MNLVIRTHYSNKSWGDRRDSNPQSRDPQSRALTITQRSPYPNFTISDAII